MKLIPLKQWICDVCGEIIEKPEDGYVQWHRDSNMKIDDFIIVHHQSASPRKCTSNGCYKYDSDSDLKSFLGEHGIVELHALLDPGPYHLPEYCKQVADIRKWSDLYKRLQLPYYEEARKYWHRAMSDGYFGDSNEVYIYLPNNLKRMIEHYEKEDY
ncbi:hypothetical protein [Clostridium thermopalmarium]|uniref:Uncharacterized protein n=1 Tax=Clostridium thermopalmarium DSM 5974 TaxID=1121340 RepID=A0A2T0APF3_9CLOT|nr:hypothetical protein [Clostridium thermopalmarium]PRR70902.1 hypothetical protein CPAL_19920 [Clostridium thermopalmarium DSM 5974]PVZ28826.1 hypothetical protein LX19_00130 [Clostridium thermopalmarium DSM 5974]